MYSFLCLCASLCCQRWCFTILPVCLVSHILKLLSYVNLFLPKDRDKGGENPVVWSSSWLKSFATQYWWMVMCLVGENVVGRFILTCDYCCRCMSCFLICWNLTVLWFFGPPAYHTCGMRTRATFGIRLWCLITVFLSGWSGNITIQRQHAQLASFDVFNSRAIIVILISSTQSLHKLKQ